jgi:hypothetical protein
MLSVVMLSVVAPLEVFEPTCFPPCSRRFQLNFLFVDLQREETLTLLNQGIITEGKAQYS